MRIFVRPKSVEDKDALNRLEFPFNDVVYYLVSFLPQQAAKIFLSVSCIAAKTAKQTMKFTKQIDWKKAKTVCLLWTHSLIAIFYSIALHSDQLSLLTVVSRSNFFVVVLQSCWKVFAFCRGHIIVNSMRSGSAKSELYLNRRKLLGTITNSAHLSIFHVSSTKKTRPLVSCTGTHCCKKTCIQI